MIWNAINAIKKIIPPVVMERVIKPLVKVVQTVVQAVQVVQQQRASSGSSSSGSGRRSGRRDSRESASSQRTSGRSQQTTSSAPANEFTGDETAEQVGDDADLDESALSLRDIAANIGFDIDQWIHGEPMGAELTILAATNAVAFTVFQIMRHEPKTWRAMCDSLDNLEEVVVTLCGTAIENSEEVAEAMPAINIAHQVVYAGDDFGRLLQEQPDQQQINDDPCGQYPGWENVGGLCTSRHGRTLARHIQLTPQEITRWWNNLSLTEREIEIALSETSSSGRDTFDHVPEHTFDFVTGWINNNQDEIKVISAKFGVSPDLVAGILASEMLYDYGTSDQVGDPNLFAGALNFSFALGIADAPGYANVHSNTLFLAYRDLYDELQDNSVHPWNALGLPEIEAFSADPDKIRKSTDGGYDPSLELLQSLATGVAAEHDPTATIAATAMVARWLTNAYVEGTERDPLNLTPEDQSIIFSAYRTGIEGYSPYNTGYGYYSDPEVADMSTGIEDFQTRVRRGPGYNAQLSLPLFKYYADLFSEDGV